VHGSYGYEVTYLLEAPDEPVSALRERLDALGDSLVVVGGEGLWNVHVHVADAGAAIEEGLLAGRPRRITVTWLGPVAGGTAGDGGRGVVAVADGEGLAALLRSGGARVLQQQDASGPAVPVLVEAIRQAGAQVAVIPGADRVAALAQAAAKRLGDEGITVSVIPARFPLQGLAALAVHDPEREFGADVAAMTEAAAGMRCGSVIGPGPDGGFTGLDGEESRVVAAAQRDVAATLATMLLARGGELVTLMEGAGAEPGLAQLIADEISQARPWVEVVCYNRGPVPLLIGVE
jgi:dihydroxyacetone kinase-like predicted kinase